MPIAIKFVTVYQQKQEHNTINSNMNNKVCLSELAHIWVCSSMLVETSTI